MTVDARILNWRFLLPVEPTSGLLLPAGDEPLAGTDVPGDRSAAAVRAACTGSPRDAVLAPDLSGWAADCVLPAARLLASLADATAEGGYLYVGFANALYPARPAPRSGLSLARCRRILHRRGMRVAAAYVALPDHRLPALMIPADGDELLYVLENQIFAFSDSRSRWTGSLRQLAVRGMRSLALAGPAALRVDLAPAFGVLAVRPGGVAP